mgnify:CR=1 FL=1
MSALAAVVLSLALAAAACAADPAQSARDPLQWTLVWSDEFDADGPPDPARWTYERGMVRNREEQTYTDDPRNARVEGGMLIIEAHRQDVGKARFTSASLTTRGLAQWNEGRFEVRAKLPAARGTWPAIWMLGSHIREVGWPRCGEIDIMEHVGFDPGKVHCTIHTDAYNHVKGTHKAGNIDVPTATADFHTYWLEWSRTTLLFGIDEHEVFRYEKQPGAGDDTWPFDHPHYLLINLAVGGSWGGRKGVDDAAFPQRFEVDYVRVFRRR